MRLPDGRIRKLRRSSNDPSVAHALMFSCFRRLPLLARERTCQWLAYALVRATEKCSFKLWAYVLKPNHAHLILHPRSESFSVRTALAALTARSRRTRR